MTEPRLHRRQFVIGPRPLAPFDDWRRLELPGGLHLSADPELPLAVAGSRVLLGVAVQTLPDRGDPADELAGPPPRTEDWAGRWALLDGDLLAPDAAAALALFHRDGVWASSSPALLAELTPALPAGAPIRYGVGMDWHPPPGSGIEGLGRLLPSQALDLSDGAVVPRPLPQPDPTRDPDEILERLRLRLVTAISRLAAAGGPLALPLTGGHDSRALLAAATAAGVTVEAYTFELPGIASADRELPPRLARAVGATHRIIPRRAPADPQRLELWDRHTARHAVDEDRQCFATGQYDEVAHAAFDLGDFYEVGRGYYDHVLPTGPPASARAMAAILLRELPSPNPAAIEAWAEWVQATPVPGLDWRDRFYLEQRLGGWLAAIDQGLDLVGVNKVHLAGCAAFIAETLSLPFAMRRRGVPHDELIRRMAPALAAFPVNPPGPPLERLRRRARRELTEFRTRPGPGYVVRRARRLMTRWTN